MEFFLPAFTLSILFIAVLTDLRTRRIPNTLSLTGVVVVGIFLISTQPWTETIPHLWSLGAMFLLSMLAFGFRLMGGGDAKLLTFLAFTVPISNLLTLCLWISIMGGLQALWMIFSSKIRHKPIERGVPYAVAIFLGTLGYWMTELFLL